MAVHGCVKQVLFDDDDDDDDAPISFKRTNPSSKQNRLNFTSKKLPSQKCEGIVSKLASCSQNPPKGVSLGLQKDKNASSSVKFSEMQKGDVSLGSLTSVSDNSKASSEQKLASTSKLKAPHSNKSSAPENYDDSDDEKPLSFRLNSSSRGNNSMAIQKESKPSSASVGK
ncbi:DNA topoisomerase I [Apostasia shenzhenica]|uniref:DNA topoisomerase I n=1 Tax=Apostasia shenzhenica TaxID=1088818 RepID=A0A2H9ZVS2_9ASPA|nr:DNA topoisomerase I [Apostasia shenzhenica]